MIQAVLQRIADDQLRIHEAANRAHRSIGQSYRRARERLAILNPRKEIR